MKPNTILEFEGQNKYDDLNDDNSKLFIIGFFVFFLLLISHNLIKEPNFNDDNFIEASKNYPIYNSINLILNILVRIISTNFIVKIYKQKDYYKKINVFDILVYFIFPAVTIFFLGFKKSLLLKIKYDSTLSNIENAHNIYLNAIDLHKTGRVNDSIRFLKKAIELDNSNIEYKEKLLIFESEKSSNRQEEKNSLNKTNQNEKIKYVQHQTDRGVVEIEPCISFKGKNVFLNGQPAPNGKYKYGLSSYFIVENGIII